MNLNLIYKVIAGFYDLLDVTYFGNYKKSPRRMVFEAIDKGDRILDLCTGTATNGINIAKAKPSVKVAGVDMSKDMLRVALHKVKKAGITNMKLYYMDAVNMDFKDACFDKVLLSLVLHEMEPESAAALLSEARRVLKDDGELIVTEWERSRNLFKRMLFFPIERLEPKSYKTFIVQDMKKYFERNGFEISRYEHCSYSRVMILKKIKKNNRDLFERQKKMLEDFAERGAITREYCEQEIKILTEKMKL